MKVKTNVKAAASNNLGVAVGVTVPIA